MNYQFLPGFEVTPLAPGERAAIPTGAPPEDRDRLAGQCAAILERLKAGPATGPELATFGLNHTARISNLRKAGWIIEAKRSFDGRRGTFIYTLKGRNNG